MESGLLLYGNSFLSHEGTVTDEALKNVKLIGIYFSAHWCPPCRGFTPKLAEFYNNVNENGKVFEVIFVSSDQDQRQFEEYFKEMPWLAIDFKDSRRADIKKAHSVTGIPNLVILKPDGKKLDVNARQDVVGGAQNFDNWLKLAA
jgi:nucleoredoxin